MAVAADAAVAEGRRLGDQGRLDPIAKIREILDFGGEAAQEGRLKTASDRAKPGQNRERLRERRHIAWPGSAERYAGHQPLDIVHALQEFAKLAALGGSESEVLDGIQSILDPLEADQRTYQPLAKLPATHRGCRSIEYFQKRSRPASFDPSITLRSAGSPDRRATRRRRSGRDVPDVRELVALVSRRYATWPRQPTSRSYRGHAPGRRRLGCAEARAGLSGLEHPCVHAGDARRKAVEHAVDGHAFSEQHFARIQNRDFGGGDRRQWTGRVFGGKSPVDSREMGSPWTSAPAGESAAGAGSRASR